MDAELAAARLANVHWLVGLVEQYGAEAVEAAAIEALKFPAQLVSVAAEAMAIQQFLETANERND